MKKTLSQRHCDNHLRKLSEYLDGELGGRAHKEVKKHLHECLPCLASYRSLMWSVEALRRYPSRPVPRRIRVQVRRQILHEVGQAE